MSPALAAPAHGDPNDTQFLNNIRDNMDFEITDSQALIASAHDICAQLEAGRSPNDVLKNVRIGNEEWNYAEAYFFVTASTQAYCPDKLGHQ